MSDGVRLAVWSGPRNISTALMRSFENRPDCRVVDEPLYAWYLAVTGLDHPGREAVIAAGETSPEAVVAALTAPMDGVFYQKHMAQHLLPGLPREWIGELCNVLLIRDPVDVVASYERRRVDFDAAEIGLVQQTELLQQLGKAAPVIDAADFLGDPEGYLRLICDHAGVELTGAMLSWPAGSRDSDGVWARHWYDEVIASTGFGPYRRAGVEPSPAGAAVAARLRPYYERLHAERARL